MIELDSEDKSPMGGMIFLVVDFRLSTPKEGIRTWGFIYFPICASKSKNVGYTDTVHLFDFFYIRKSSNRQEEFSHELERNTEFV